MPSGLNFTFLRAEKLRKLALILVLLYANWINLWVNRSSCSIQQLAISFNLWKFIA